MSTAEAPEKFQLKMLTPSAIPAALERAERYRLLSEPAQAESICLDVLQIDPDHQSATVLLLLALTDQLADSLADHMERALALLPQLNDEYQRIYYRGLICERQARMILHRANPGAGFSAYDRFREAMQCYEEAERMRPPDNDEALLRWNTCARTIMSAHLEPAPKDETTLMLE